MFALSDKMLVPNFNINIYSRQITFKGRAFFHKRPQSLLPGKILQSLLPGSILQTILPGKINDAVTCSRGYISGRGTIYGMHGLGCPRKNDHGVCA